MLLTRDEIVKVLQKYNIKITPNRIMVAEIILNAKSHPSIDEIHTKLVREGKNISFTSVYNIIKTFESACLLKEIQTKDRSRYDANIEPHVHFICKNCGKVFDVEDDENCLSLPNEVNGMKVHSAELTYFGICNDCEH